MFKKYHYECNFLQIILDIKNQCKEKEPVGNGTSILTFQEIELPFVLLFFFFFLLNHICQIVHKV